MPDFENDLQNRWHMYPQPLMHVRLSIFYLCGFAGELGERKRDPRQEGVPIKRYGYPFRAGGLSCNISGLTFRFIFSVLTWRRTYAACFISAFPSDAV
jgi:hypothetical protein